MSLDDLIKGASLFKEGMTRWKVSSAANEAASQMQQIANNEEMKGDLQARLQAQTDVSNQLALKMSAAGASPQAIEAATERIGVSAGSQYAAATVPATQVEKQRADKESDATQHGYRMEEIKATVEGARSKKMDDRTYAFIKEGKTEFNQKIKKSLDAFNAVSNAKASINAGNPIGDASVVNFLAKASGEVGALTEADKAPFGGSRALDAKLAQALEMAKSGKMTPANRKIVKQVIDVFEKAHRRNIDSEVERTADTRSKYADKVGIGLTKDEIKAMLWPEEVTSGAGSTMQSPAPATPDASKYLLED